MTSKPETSYQLFRAFADPTRLRILGLLSESELCVCHLMKVIGLPQSTISRHVAYLKRAGLVEVWEEGTWNHYRLAKPSSKLHRTLLLCVTSCLNDMEILANDKKKLARLAITK